MNISKIQQTNAFGQFSVDCSDGYNPLLKGNFNAMKKASSGADVDVKSCWFDPLDDYAAIKVSAESSKPDSKFAQVDIYVRPTKENIKNKAAVRAVQEAVKLVSKLA